MPSELSDPNESKHGLSLADDAPDLAALSTDFDNTDIEDSEDGALRYSIHSMLIAMAMIALGIALLKWFWLWGFVVIFTVSFGVEIGTFRSRKRLGNIVSVAVWGIVFPVLCVFYDPGILHEPWISPPGPMSFPRGLQSDIRITWQSVSSPISIFSLSAIAIECVTLGVWILLQPRNPWIADFFIGMLSFGIVLAMLVGICLLPLSLMGLVLLIGILGITPFMTFRAYLFAASEAIRISSHNRDERKTLMTKLIRIAAFFLAALLPGFAAAVFSELKSNGRLFLSFPIG